MKGNILIEELMSFGNTVDFGAQWRGKNYIVWEVKKQDRVIRIEWEMVGVKTTVKKV